MKSILAAVDDSLRAPYVVATAAMMARALGAQPFLVRVITAPLDVPPAAHTQPDEVSARLEQTVRTELQTLMRLEPSIEFGPPIIVEGEPWHRIIDVSRKLDVDLIVMGSHRYHGLARVLGTVASKVVNHADRNVLVVHQRLTARASG